MEFAVPPMELQTKAETLSIELGNSRKNFYLYIKNTDGSMLMRIFMGSPQGTSSDCLEFSRVTVHSNVIMTKSGHEIAGISKTAFESLRKQTYEILNKFEKLLTEQFTQEKNFVPISFFKDHEAFTHFGNFYLKKLGYIYLPKVESYVFMENQAPDEDYRPVVDTDSNSNAENESDEEESESESDEEENESDEEENESVEEESESEEE